MKNRILILNLLVIVSITLFNAKIADAFKPAMHAKTANVAIFDALNGGICLPGLGGEIALGDTELQHFVTIEEDGVERLQYRNYLLQYAPIIRAGSVGPDAFPDPLTGQMFTHENHALPKVPQSSEENVHFGIDEGGFASPINFDSGTLSSLFGEEASGTLDSLAATFGGKPNWRSIDWGHEILWAARANYQPAIDYWSNPNPPSPDRAEWWAANEEMRLARVRGYQEEQRAAVAFALGYLMHMSGDGQVHAMINEVVGLPWGYFDSLVNENAYYGLLAPMAEELQHMAIEAYLDSNYFPGSEPIAQRRLVDGSACESNAPGEDSIACLDDELLIEQPLPCDRCNPLRGADPRGLNNRCSHCFEYCDPWQELCPPTLPEPDPRICPTVEVCDFGTTGAGRLTLDATITRCAEGTDDPLEYRRCRNNAITICTNARMACLCEQSVDALVETGILPDRDANYLCTTTETNGSTAYAGRTVRMWADLFTEAENRFTDPQVPNPNIEETLDEIRLRGCSTAPLDVTQIYEITDPPASPTTLDIQYGNESGTISTLGSDMDLNGNGRPDLINQCIMLNCRMYPHTCPWNALDRDVDESEYTDLRTCDDLEPNADWTTTALGQVPQGTCDGLGPGPTSYRPDPAAVLRGNEDAVEAFLNSTYIDVPKNFINQAFYMNRIYLDPNVDAAPFAPGSYSLGGYPVNSIHAIIDALELLHLYLAVAIGDPWAMLQQLYPNSDVVRLLSGWTRVVDNIAGFAENIGDTFYNSTILNFTIKLPFGIRINVNLGKLLARPWYAIAGLVRSLADPLGNTIREIAGSLDDEVSQRVSLLEDHLRTNWVEATSCSAQAMTDGAHRHYSIQKYKDYAEKALDIVVRGEDEMCERPSIVEFVLTGAGFNLADALLLHRLFGQMIEWVGCEAEKLILEGWLVGSIKNPLEKMLEKASEKIFCDLILGSNRDLNESSLDNLREHCPEIHQVLWHTEDHVTEVGIQTLLEGLDFSVTTLSGTSYNIREFVVRMRVVSTGTCWDGALGVHTMSKRDQLRAAFYDQDVINEQCADQLTDFSLDGFEPPEGVRSSSEIVEALDAWIGVADSDRVSLRVVDRESSNLVMRDQTIINSAVFEPTYNAIALNKLALMGTNHITKPCPANRVCAPEASRIGGVRELIYRANNVEKLGSGTPSFRSDDEVYPAELLADTNTGANSNADLDAFFAEQFIDASDAPNGPGQRSCGDIGYNLLCNSIYSLDDPDDYCRQARSWVNDEERFANACLYRENDHDPCIWLDNVYTDLDDKMERVNYFPDPRQNAFVCDSHGAYTRDQHDHGRDYTLHQRAFSVDTSRRAYDTAEDEASSYGYSLTRFSLANKDSHVSRLYSKIFAPFYCPLSGVEQTDGDCDGVPDACDNCPLAYNPAQVRSGATVDGDICVDSPERVDSRCRQEELPEIDPEVCDGCEDIGDIDLDLDDGGCNCGTTVDAGPWWALLVIFGFIRVKRKKRRRQ